MREARFIYTLRDPRGGPIRYVGMTVDPVARLRAHCRPKSLRRDRRLVKWVKGLLAAGVRPEMSVVEIWPDVEQGHDEEVRMSERWYMWLAVAAGADLLNCNQGLSEEVVGGRGRWGIENPYRYRRAALIDVAAEARKRAVA